jgi:hypothetical protein
MLVKRVPSPYQARGTVGCFCDKEKNEKCEVSNSMFQKSGDGFSEGLPRQHYAKERDD